MEIKNKLTVTRGEGENRAEKEEGHHGTGIKDPWTKTMGGGRRTQCEKWGGQGRGE